MDLEKTIQSGSLESCDLLVVREQAKKGAGRKIELESVVKNEYGKKILNDIQAVLDEFGINDIFLKINDRGALTPTIKARVAAVLDSNL
jgi:citrate lyase subunit gamma (acyl carrier protein)